MRRTVLIAVALPLLLAYLAFVFDVFPDSVLGWSLLLLIGLPLLIAMEWLGGRFFNAKFLNQLSSPARIALAVPVMIGVWLVFAVVAKFIQSASIK